MFLKFPVLLKIHTFQITILFGPNRNWEVFRVNMKQIFKNDVCIFLMFFLLKISRVVKKFSKKRKTGLLRYSSTLPVNYRILF